MRGGVKGLEFTPKYFHLYLEGQSKLVPKRVTRNLCVGKNVLPSGKGRGVIKIGNVRKQKIVAYIGRTKNLARTLKK